MSVRAAKNMLELFDGVLDPGFVVNPETLPNRGTHRRLAERQGWWLTDRLASPRR